MAVLNLSAATRIATFMRRRPAWQRLLVGAAITALVVLARMSLDVSWGRQHNRHLVFLPTIMLVTWLVGLAPGLLSTLMSSAALAVWWTDHTGPETLPSAELVLFVLIGVAVCGLVESLQRARARADAASQAHEQVLAIVAHDLGNPLSTIKMTSERLSTNGATDPVVRRRAEVIDRAVTRMEHLIRDLVDSTRIEQGGLTLTLRLESVESITREVVEQFIPLAQERSIALELARAADDGAVECDRGRPLQVLGNLLGNALKFTPEGGRITLRTARGAGAVTFQVEDTGRGIDPGDVPHLFERYWRSDPKGTGLGLYIAHNIVRAHGGNMGVRSQPGAGATFFFTIPSPTT